MNGKSDEPGTRRLPAWGPELFLLACAPVVVDLLFGATQLTTLVGLVPEILTYGCAALLIRGLARQRKADWATVILWGLAFALVAECLIVQTSLAPMAGPHGDWGRALGVNWPYLIWALGYETGWAIALSIQLTDLVFPAHRSLVWPRQRGQFLLAVVFVLGAIPTWYNWTHIVVPQLLHQPLYQPPLTALAVTVAASGALVVLGAHLTRHPNRRHGHTSRHAPIPAAVAGTAFAGTALWFALLLPEVNSPISTLPAALPITAALLTAAAAIILLHRWSQAPAWSDRHRLALITGALCASMAAGYLANHFTAINLLGKVVLNAAALGGLIFLHLRRHNTDRSPNRDDTGSVP